MSNCGDCQMCCFTFAIDEISKAAQVKCKNQCKKGCRIYTSRPKECARYECEYLKRNMSVKFRPDKCGVLISGVKGGLKAYCVSNKVTEEAFQFINLIEKGGERVKRVDARVKDASN